MNLRLATGSACRSPIDDSRTRFGINAFDSGACSDLVVLQTGQGWQGGSLRNGPGCLEIEPGGLPKFGFSVGSVERFHRLRSCSRWETDLWCAFGGGAVPILGLDANSRRLAMSPSTCG